MRTITLNLATSGQHLADFITTYVGELTDASPYAEQIKVLKAQAFRILPELDDGDDEMVQEVEDMVNLCAACFLAVSAQLGLKAIGSTSYQPFLFYVAQVALMQAIENLEVWVEWAANDYNVDITAMVH